MQESNFDLSASSSATNSPHSGSNWRKSSRGRLESARWPRVLSVYSTFRHSESQKVVPLASPFSQLSLAMLFILFAYYLVHGTSIDASPVPFVDNRSLDTKRCTDLTHCRSISNIVWSCLVTIFSCTWVAVHPNIPSPKKREANSWIERCILNPLLSFAEHRLPLFICALLVPEYVLAWAIRQFLTAREIANQDKEQRWSKAHGFFMIMGGFHLFERNSEETSDDDRSIPQEDEKPLHPLQEDELRKCNDYESFIMPTEAEIKDKGKSDWLAKFLVLLQTSWFVMQCIARAIEHLPITHLEIVTLAYAAMNFVIYIFWWNKPLNVNRPVRVFRKFEPGETHPQVTERTSEVRELSWKAIGKGLETIFDYILGIQDKDIDMSHRDRVPRFWAHSGGRSVLIADLIVIGVGVCFGAIHCIAWAFSFPTHPELLMWRISCVAITAVPIYIFLMVALADLLDKMGNRKFSLTVGVFGALPAGILYILARAVTLVLAFISLRELPSGTYETVHWTTFIPHV